VIDRYQKYDMIGHLHAVLKKSADLAPRRIGDDPIYMFVPLKKITTFFDFAPVGFWG
jgi:hypothetical protein